MLKTSLLALTFVIASSAIAQEAPVSNGVISNPTLVANSEVAKAQAVGIITSFMSDGAQTCDDDGKNCRSLFGTNDDSLDYTSLTSMSRSVTGISNFSFMGGADGTDSNNISSQTGTLALACGDTGVKTLAGVAFKASNCLVNSAGDAQLTYQVCTAPSRGLPVTNPSNAVPCSTDPASPDFKAPIGKVCIRAACDSEPVNSHNGWSEPKTISWKQSLPESATEDEKSKNGLGLSFYPLLGGTVTPSFSADSDNMTAIKIVQTFINNETNKTAIGIRGAYRAKATVTREMIIAGPSAVPDPGKHTAQWDTLLKLQSNPLIPQYQAQYAKNGSECIQQITNGIGTDGKISVCDQGYTNESGIKPGALTAMIAAEGQNCGTTTTCLKEVVNTNSWSQVCNADVPLALRSCETTTDYTGEKLFLTRTRPVDICREERLVAEYTCSTVAIPQECKMSSIIQSGGVDLAAHSGDTTVVMVEQVNPYTLRFRLGTPCDNCWGTSYYKRNFNVFIRNAAEVKTFRMYHVAFDDTMAVAINGNWVWSDWPQSHYEPSQDAWGYWYEQCDWDTGTNCQSYFYSLMERKTNWSYGRDVDFRPHLKEGNNTIRVDTGVVGGGEGWIYLEISAWSVTCDNVIINECKQYEDAK